MVTVAQIVNIVVIGIIIFLDESRHNRNWCICGHGLLDNSQLSRKKEEKM